MSFLVPLALAVAALIGLPLAAHLLRRGRPEVHRFPPAALVPTAQPTAKQRRRLEDRLLLAIRALMVAALALLGATPFVSCSKLALQRQSGASVALALVVDDSLSMSSADANGRTRWQRALDGARDLIGSAREGDAVAIVMAGEPARLELAATTDLGAAGRTLDALEPSDRSTDVRAAVQLARSALESLPHRDKRVVLLSDLAGEQLPAGEPPLWAPLGDLREELPDCGIVSAERAGKRVTAKVACNTAAAAKDRTVEVVPGELPGRSGDGAEGEPLVTAPLITRTGEQTVALELDRVTPLLDVRLSGKDSNARDDAAPVALPGSATTVAVVADPSSAAARTGGPTLIEQAIRALERGVSARPLSVLPDEAETLRSHAALVLDDPPGLPAESRRALDAWFERGGVAIAFLGPASANTQLGSTLEPFAVGPVRWLEVKGELGVDSATLGWLGDEAGTLRDPAPRGRAVLDAAVPEDARVAGRWSDGKPFLLERRRGRGLALTVALPSSVAHSDFALRPAFLALLDYVISEARARVGPRASEAGAAWAFPDADVTITGPSGKLAVTRREDATEQHVEGRHVAVPTRVGRYLIGAGDDQQQRVVTISAEEITRAPVEPGDSLEPERAGGIVGRVDASPQVALLLLLLMTAELGIRAFARRRRSAAASS